MKVCKSDMRQAAGDEISISHVSCNSASSAFTLIELLVVIAIIAIIAGLAVPALKDLGKSNVSLSASRQLLDDIGHARQLAMSQRTTVYMVFVPTNFWVRLSGTNVNTVATTNLVDKQLTGYNFLSLSQVGDQPGRHLPHYLGQWQSLPEGTFIAAQKFEPLVSLTVSLWQIDYNGQSFSSFTNLLVPFPTENSANASMPCIAFDYLGRLISEADASGNLHDAFIPLAHGSVGYGFDANKIPQLTEVKTNDISENPPGNSTNISYNIVHIDAFTGRATLEYHKVQ